MKLTTSIALCTYNGARFLREQLASFATQTRLPDEVVVCDDGSTDNTLEIVENWAKTVPFHVRIVRNERNLGYAQNFGKAVSLCGCDVIFLSDQDDVWEPEKIEKMVAVFETEPEIGLVVSDGYIIDEAGKRQPGSMQELLRLWYYDEVATFCEYRPLSDDCYPQGCASAFRASLRSVFLPIPSLWSHDTWLQAVAHFETRGRVLDVPLFSYRLGDSNTTKFGGFEARKLLWERKKAIHHWNTAQQFWAWLPKVEQFRERVEKQPESKRKMRLLRHLRRVERHYTNRDRIQRNLFFFCPLLVVEVVLGGYREHLFPFRALFYDLCVGLKRMNPLKLLHNAYLWFRYDFPIWVDCHTKPPLMRTTKHRFFCRSQEAKNRAVMRLYEVAFGHGFDLNHPRTFNEKIQWLKLFYPNPLITVCADKYRVQEHIRQSIGERYLTRQLAVYDRPEEIDFDALPARFALKVNWGSGQNIICRDKATLDRKACRKTLRKWLKPSSNHYFFALEWGYRDIPPKIVCEEYLSFLESNPYVFKIMCFNGVPRVIQLVINDKTAQEAVNYYDTDWNLLPFRQNFPTSAEAIPKPSFLGEMLELARKLSAPFPFVRVDFFEAPDRVLFSEMTFYSDAGVAKFEPEEWDLRLGEMLRLPTDET